MTITRAILCFCITAGSLTGVAMQAGVREPLTLVIFKTEFCRPCIQLSADYVNANDPRFRDALSQRYKPFRPDSFVVYADKEPELARRFNVFTVPQCILLDSNGVEVHRVRGYTNPDKLMAELAQAPRQRPPARSQPRQAPPPVRRNAPSDSEAEAIRRANEALQRERDELRNANEILKRDAAAAARQQSPEAAEAAERLAGELDDEKARAGHFRRAAEDRIKELEVERKRAEAAAELERRRVEALDAARQRAEAEATELRERLQQPTAPPFPDPISDPPPAKPPPEAACCDDCEDDATHDHADSPPTLPNLTNDEAPDEHATSSKWRHVAKWIGGAALTALAPEVAIPGSLALTAAGFAFAWWRKRKANPRPGRTKHTKGRPADEPETFPPDVPSGADDNDRLDGLPRDNSELEQILSLRQQEQREPLHDAFFGVLFEDEYRSDPDQSIGHAYTRAMERFNNVAPLSSRAATSTTSIKKG